MSKFLYFLLLSSVSVCAQITITSNTLSQFYTNNSITEYRMESGSAGQTVDLGSPSASAQTFDFSNLFENREFDTLQIQYDSPGTYPGSERYTSSEHVSIQDYGQPGFSMMLYVYFTVENDGLKIQGLANNTIIPGVMDTVTYTDYRPYILSYPTPFTYGDQRSFTDTAYSIGTTDVEISIFTWVCDGYGTLILPNGVTAEAIRYTKTEIEYEYEDGVLEDVETQVDVEFITNAGYSVSFSVDSTYTGGATTPDGIRVSESGTPTSIKNVDELTPSEYSLRQNYPNPFNPSTSISFALPVESSVKLSIFNMVGEEVAVVSDQNFNAGLYNVKFDASNFSSGVYIYSITAAGINGENFKSARKMLLMK
ncbi:MAG: hypothetical protein SCALA702_07830 [Melioribacteraceae bacterium]|nr:MAG: hypothetical protein SCALA702_07830 [Melioribacteraceae bacterium]